MENTHNHKLAMRLGDILTRLNQGERLDIQALAEEFRVNIRTIQRDFNERLVFLNWEEQGPRYYKLDRHQFGYLQQEEILRFANFASIANLFPQIDREFYQASLTHSIYVKGYQYEEISHLEKEFNLLKQAITNHQVIHFQYYKSGQKTAKFYQICPYRLINKNGIWYLIGTENNKQKTFCFTQISMLRTLSEHFEPNQKILDEIAQNDSIYLGNQLPEVVIKVAPKVAHYFTRRNLLPNQELLHKLDDGGLLLACKNVNEQEIIPLVQYWIPHLTIISPIKLQGVMIEKLQEFINLNSY
ncbi:helix-turn-helix transcriptional regulator [Actinobacillus genomosp. 1]|uniref:helix-turn-helix transcriptional regulator n=1 Tax=Actinobacillus genomosp. 1 TaxID=254839 RepID=UPI00244349D2|nr:WYL domain-containing protein [Actinobacillus genomosp. 1]WGE91859.1 WYL domain-containing protein [Actinobacillus genomosp. 1]